MLVSNLKIGFIISIPILIIFMFAVCNTKKEDMSGCKKPGNLKKRLTPMQYHVTQENGTERPYANEYWDNDEPGIYVDVVTGEPLFSSKDKYKSGTGWPSFTRPLKESSVVVKEDNSHGMKRSEVRSGKGDSHLGHVFDDGPLPDGKRFCMNSASLRFIPAANLEKEGYGEYSHLFAKDLKGKTEKYQKAIFAGGCFWCTESDFENVKGVISVKSGYTGGHLENPTYKQVSSGSTGHAEAVEVTFDPKIISYEELLRIYWKSIDPTTKDRQFCDIGSQYRTAIFYINDEQKRLAEKSRKTAEKNLKTTVVTEIKKAGKFYPAEEYHQDYHKKNPVHYKYYRNGSGRDKRLEEIWKGVK